VGLLAGFDVFSDIRASRKQVSRYTVVFVSCSGASIAKVATWVAARSLIGKDIDEADVDYVYVGVLAGLDESLLIWTLTPIDCYIGLGRGGKSSRRRSDEKQ